MTAIDGFLMWAITLVLASLAAWIKEKIKPGPSAEECGYIPGSEGSPWGWPATIAATIAVAAAVCLVIWAGVIVGM